MNSPVGPNTLDTPGVVGKPIDRVDGHLKVTGQAKYAAESAVPDVVHAVLVQSTIGAGEITGFDLDAAKSMPGVLAIITPEDPEQRGSQLSLRIRGGRGRRLFEALTARGVLCDWREPDTLRVAPVPLYNSFEDVLRGAWQLCALLRP